ncbi:hypothetical protein [Streptomyces sp. NPDC090025]|uniref:hypothetical protein n=1 Tax=Streptomyces sp. NPDC090025 TaxID=3365922 RepID=UPI003833CBE9
MRSEDAVEIVRASLALAFPTATDEGLTRAAETVIRWGSEDVADHLNEPLSTRMLLDLLSVAEVGPYELRPAESGWPGRRRLATAARYRTWSRALGMDALPRLRRPLDEEERPDPDGRDEGFGEGRGEGSSFERPE